MFKLVGLWILSCWRFEKKIILWCTNLLMIKAVKFWCEGSFQMLIEENDATWSRRGKSLSLGGLPPQHISRRLKHLSLGIPFFIYNYQVLSNDAIFLLLHTSIFFLGASVCFVLFCLLLYLLDPSILVWERDTLHFF